MLGKLDLTSFFYFRLLFVTLKSNHDCWCFVLTAEAILLGFQHYLVMLGTTVIIPTALVPQMGGGNVRNYMNLGTIILALMVCLFNNYNPIKWFDQEEKAKVIQTLLFVAGINTLLQTFFGTRLPAVISASYTFVAPTLSIILSGRWSDPDPISVRDLDHSNTLYCVHVKT